MLIKMNLKNNFKLVDEGERELTITKAECKPSGKPTNMKVTFQDSEGGYINSQYNFDNDKSLFAMGKLLEIALDFEDGDEFDTKKDPERLVNIKLLCEVIHSQGSKPNEEGEFPTFANVKRVIKRIDESTVKNTATDISPRNSIIQNEEDDLD